MINATLIEKLDQLSPEMQNQIEKDIDKLLGGKKQAEVEDVDKSLRGYGSLKGKIWISDDFDEPLEDFKEYIIENPDNRCFVSICSLWEMAIKVGLKKLHIEIGYENFHDYLLNKNFELLNLNPQHLNTLLTLPHHHNDPFDRLLISQAIAKNLTIISADQHFKAYPVTSIW